MFELIELSDIVRIAPKNFGHPLEEVAEGVLKAKYESTMSHELGYIILVRDVKVDRVGKIILGDGATYHKVNFSILTFKPRVQEIIEGEVVEVTDFGVFVRVGPADALLHLSQIMDDYITSDVRQGIVLASQSKRTLRIGSKVRVRVTAVSMGRGTTMGKIGVTCRQPFLGAIEWIEEDIARAREGSKDDEPKRRGPAKGGST